MADTSSFVKTARVYQQIETDADYYPPNLYEALTRFDSLQTEGDDDAAGYIPLTTALQGMGGNSKFLTMAIGLLPPAVPITGRLLDRSATVASLEGGAQAVADVGSSGGGGAPGIIPPVGSDFWVMYVAMCTRLGVDPKEMGKVLNCESGFNPGSAAWRDNDNLPCTIGSSANGCHPVAKGLNQLVYGTAKGLGMDDATWATYSTLSAEDQLIWVEKYMRSVGVRGLAAQEIYGKNFGSFGRGNPQAEGQDISYASALYMNTHPGRNGLVGPPGWPHYDENAAAYTANSTLDKGKGYIALSDLGRSASRDLPSSIDTAIDTARGSLGLGAGAPPPVAAPPPTSAPWVDKGSAAAKDSKKYQAKLADQDLNTTDLGKRLLNAQSAQIKATNDAVQAMANTPPLQMLVNPTSFKFSAEKIVNDGNWGRNGPIIEHWGNQQEKIEGSGKLAAFYAATTSGTAAGASPGLTRMARNFSLSYQNFLSLYLIYKNNGGIWLDDSYANGFSTSTATRRVNLSLVGSVYIYYDSTLYIGSFDNFTITESDTAPFTLEYTFSFTVRAWFLLDRVQDPRFNWGTPAAAATSSSSASIPTSSTTSPDQIEDLGGGPSYHAPEPFTTVDPKTGKVITITSGSVKG